MCVSKGEETNKELTTVRNAHSYSRTDHMYLYIDLYICSLLLLWSLSFGFSFFFKSLFFGFTLNSSKPNTHTKRFNQPNAQKGCYFLSLSLLLLLSCLLLLLLNSSLHKYTNLLTAVLPLPPFLHSSSHEGGRDVISVAAV